MTNSNLLVPKNILYPVAIFGLIFIVIAATIDVNSLGLSSDLGLALMYAGLLANFFASIILIIDVFKNNLSSKYIWTVSFLFLGALSGLFYLKNRDYYLANAV